MKKSNYNIVIGDLIRIPFGRNWFTGIVLDVSNVILNKRTGTLRNAECVVTILDVSGKIECFDLHSQHYYEIISKVE